MVDWPTLTLREAGVRLIDCVHKTPAAQETGFPYVGIPQMKEGWIDFESARKISCNDFVEWTKKAKPQAHDVILSRRTNPGVTAVDKSGTDFALGQNLVLLRADGERVHPPFLKWLVRTPAWWGQIDKFINVGAVFNSLKCADVPSFELQIPPLDAQQEMCLLLDAIDDKIELNRRMNETLEAMARAIFKDWFVDFGPTRAKAEGRPPYLAPEIWSLFPDTLDDEDKPVGWQAGSIGDLAETNRQSWTARNHPPVVEYVDLSNAKWGNIDAITTLAWQEAPSRARRIAKAGDTIVGTTRPGNGSFAYISQDGLTVSTGFSVLSPREAIYRDVVHIAATRPDNIERLANLADGHGGAYPAVKPNEVSDTELVLPGDAILTAFAEVVLPFRSKIESAKAESRILALTRDLLLPKLMSGEIRLAEAEKAVEAVA
ncbi:MAG: restriction endonuclease subunit S [Pseudomonadota bacterium]